MQTIIDRQPSIACKPMSIACTVKEGRRKEKGRDEFVR